MNYYAVVNGINSICAFVIAIIIAFRRPKAVHLTYIFFYLLLFLWASCYFAWGIQTNFASSMFWLQTLEYPVCFIHVAYLHFALLFSETFQKYKKYVMVGYAFSAFFFAINSQKGFFDMSYIRDKSPFHYWPHATHWVSLFIVFQVICLLFSFIVLFKKIQISPPHLKPRLKAFLVLAIIGWTGGLTNWFHFYDSVPINPIGNPAVTFYLIGTAYLIVKHDILGLNLAIRRTFVYTFLTLFFSLIYILFIVISEKAFQTYFGYKSFITTILASLTIAILFNPLRNSLYHLLDKYFFGKDIVALSGEYNLMKSELQKQDQMKAVATLAAGMAHEMKNPLTAIKTFTEYLPQKSKDPEFVKKFTQVVGNEVEKIDLIVRQLLEFAKPAPLHLEKVDIRHIIESTLQLLEGEFLKYKIVVSEQFPKALPFINGDKKQLQQVFLNLFLNSMQAMPNGGKLTVTAEADSGHHLSITVSDTGCGIAKEHLSHIFDPFYTTKESGSGLGLSIVQGIIKEHRGTIEAKNNPEKGATFLVHFKSNSP